MLAIMAFYAENYKKSDKIFYLFIRNYIETASEEKEQPQASAAPEPKSKAQAKEEIAKANEGKRRYKIR